MTSMNRVAMLQRPPMPTLSQIPLALARMLDRLQAREARRQRNRAFFRRFFGLERRGTKSRVGRLGTGELCESNLPLR